MPENWRIFKLWVFYYYFWYESYSFFSSTQMLGRDSWPPWSELSWAPGMVTSHAISRPVLLRYFLLLTKLPYAAHLPVWLDLSSTLVVLAPVCRHSSPSHHAPAPPLSPTGCPLKNHNHSFWYSSPIFEVNVASRILISLSSLPSHFTC